MYACFLLSGTFACVLMMSPYLLADILFPVSENGFLFKLKVQFGLLFSGWLGEEKRSYGWWIYSSEAVKCFAFALL